MKKQHFILKLCSCIKRLRGHILKPKEAVSSEIVDALLVKECCNGADDLEDNGIEKEPKSDILIQVQAMTNALKECASMTVSTDDCYDYLYIDDDIWLRMIWADIAKKNSYKLLALSSVKEFCLHINKISKEKTMIYLDSNLGEDEMRGEVLAEILHDAGYKKLHLATGHDPHNFSHLPWLTICGKDCPFA